MLYEHLMTLAHAGHDQGSFGVGFFHPLHGIDHLLAMIAVGLLSARMDVKKMWALPAAFVGMMAAGGLLGLAWAAEGSAVFEWGISASVLMFGLTVACVPKLKPTIGLAIVAVFAVCHGHAHIAEMGDASAAAYFAGMLIATALLHLAGLLSGVALRRGYGDWALRTAGGAIAAGYGLVLIGVIGAG